VLLAKDEILVAGWADLVGVDGGSDFT